MPFTTEDVKRLVPEARNIIKTETAVRFTVSGIRNYTDDPLVSMFITTRRQLETAREALDRIEGKSHTDKHGPRMSVVLAPSHAVEMVNIAREALDTIAKADQ